MFDKQELEDMLPQFEDFKIPESEFPRCELLHFEMMDIENWLEYDLEYGIGN